MTMRKLGEMAIKILGVYYAASALLGLAGVVSTLFLPRIDGFPAASRLAAMNLVGVLGLGVVAGVCVCTAHILAGWLFSDERAAASNLSRRDCLFLGISLIGLAWVISGIPEIIKLIGKVVWYAESSRQPMLGEMLRKSSESVLGAGLSILVGVAIVISARRLSTRLDTES